MSRAEKISGRLPHFYKHWEAGSSIYGFIFALGKFLDESEKELVAIMHAHWVDTARGVELDRIGAIYNIKRKEKETDEDYKGYLKTAIISYKGGGTLGAIQTMARIALRLPPDQTVKIVENPPLAMKKNWEVSAGHEWWINPGSIHDAEPEITISVKTEKAKIKDPTITNLTTGESIVYKGEISHGDILKFVKGKAILNGQDQNGKLSSSSIPILPRRRSRWKYSEFAGENIGTFDKTSFDKSVFAVDIISSVTFEWNANQPASFELHLHKETLEKAGITAGYMQNVLNSVKGSGIKAIVKVI